MAHLRVERRRSKRRKHPTPRPIRRGLDQTIAKRFQVRPESTQSHRRAEGAPVGGPPAPAKAAPRTTSRCPGGDGAPASSTLDRLEPSGDALRTAAKNRSSGLPSITPCSKSDCRNPITQRAEKGSEKMKAQIGKSGLPAVNPPSTVKMAPVMKSASSEAKKRAAFATSSGRPNRPRG